MKTRPKAILFCAFWFLIFSVTYIVRIGELHRMRAVKEADGECPSRETRSAGLRKGRGGYLRGTAPRGIEVRVGLG